MNILVDTNILIRSSSPGDKDHATAVASCAVLKSQGHELCLAPQNFYEYWSVATRPAAQNGLGLTPDRVLANFAMFETDFPLLEDVPAVFDEWRSLVSTHKVMGKPAHDARHVAAMLVHGVTHILTFNDKDFRRYPQITVLTPADVVSSAGGP